MVIGITLLIEDKDMALTFKEIFDEPGLYKCDDFAKGYCLEVDSGGWLSSIQYRDKSDINPIRNAPLINRKFFKRE